MGIEITVIKASQILNEAADFYDYCERKTMVDPQDTLVVAYSDKQIVGMLRLCAEEGHYTMRTLQVHLKQQRQGIGQMLLQRFAELQKELKIEQVFCMPYDYLESFYGSVGFKKIESQKAPPFLQTRFRYFHSRNAGKTAILMMCSS